MNTRYYDYEEDFDDRDDEEEWERLDREEEEWTCAFPGNCCMAFAPHMRDECHTPEMAAEYMSGDY